MTGITAAYRGVPLIKVTFEIDEHSILTVSAREERTDNKEIIAIINDKGRLSKEEIERMIADAEKFSDQDKEL